MTTNVEASKSRREGAGLILLSAVIFVGTWFELEDITALESGAVASIRLNIVLRMTYDALGKWGVIGLMLLVGILFFGIGVRMLFTRARPT